MRSYLISKLIGILMGELAKHAPALLLTFADYILDWVENYVLGSASTLDDQLILPICSMIRQAYNIPDDDAVPDPDETEQTEGDDTRVTVKGK